LYYILVFMTNVEVEFELDTKSGGKSLVIQTAFEDRPSAASKINSLFDEVAKSSSPMLKIRDSVTGDYKFVHTMKVAGVHIREKEEK